MDSIGKPGTPHVDGGIVEVGVVNVLDVVVAIVVDVVVSIMVDVEVVVPGTLSGP
jgi:hypothetical protein